MALYLSLIQNFFDHLTFKELNQLWFVWSRILFNTERMVFHH